MLNRNKHQHSWVFRKGTYHCTSCPATTTEQPRFGFFK